MKKKEGWYFERLVILAVAIALVAFVAITAYTTGEQKGEITTGVREVSVHHWKGPVSKAVVWDNGMDYIGLAASQQDNAVPFDAIEADDFMFTVDQLVNDVHWIGGYWEEGQPPYDGNFDWEIKFYNDFGDGTKPGAVIATYTFPNADVNETKIDSTGYSYFCSYSVRVPKLYFSANTKYWISIQGIGDYPPQSGWAYHEDPILMHQAVFKSVYFGYPDWTNTSTVFGTAVDMCFQLTFEHKMHFPQMPDLIGWDVNATYPKILADDWQCSETGPVEDIHFWGSWKDQDGLPWTDDYPPGGEMPWFLLSIHANIPADIDTPWSRPGRLLWLWEGEIPGTPSEPPTLEAWYDPNLDTSICNDHIPYWQYDFYVDQVYPPPESLFFQYKDSIYWLNISAILTDPINYQWGWKNSRDHFMDDAVFRDEVPPFPGWQPMFEPPRNNWFDVYFDSYGIPEDWESTNYYGDGWYGYEYWWNMWFYDNPFTTERPKEIFIDNLWVAVYGPFPYAELAINWSTPAWDELGMGRPPLPEDGNEELYIERYVIGPLPLEVALDFYHTIPYNPEWVSIDFVATDVNINGWIYHECVQTSMDLAFVITGEPECTPSIDVEKKVWDEENGDWVDSTDIDVCNDADFLITIHNDGTCCDLTNIIVEDFMDSSLEFLSADPPPDEEQPVPGGTSIKWFFPDPLPPCETIDITITAHVVGPACHLDSNYVWAQGDCEEQAVGVYDEDAAYVHATEPPLDFGDAPDPPYPTLLASGGARHVIVPGVLLGAFIDPEANGQPGATALDDDNNPPAGPDDEDGVVFLNLVNPGGAVVVKVTASVAGFLDGWVDFNANGSWADAGEQVFISAPVVAGVNILGFAVPAAAPVGITYSRFRFSTAGGLGVGGLAPDGEVEDYRVFILDPIENIKMHHPQWPDLDETGMDVDQAVAGPLGDDWMCTKTAPVEDIHFWGSYAEDILPPAGLGSQTFYVGIWSDNPGPPSMPAVELWFRNFAPGTYTVHQVADNNPEDWFDPWTGLFINNDHLQAYQFDFFIEEDYFEQEEGTIYWLVIYDDDQIDYTFGWKTTEIDLQYRDDAVYWTGALPFWAPMFYPPGHEYAYETLDLAFVITGEKAVLCGDANNDGVVDIGDVVYIINYLFRQPWPAPQPYMCVGDANNDDVVDIGDVVYIINWLFRQPWPAPDPNCCNPPWKAGG